MPRSPRASARVASIVASQSPPNPPLATYNPDYLTNYEIGYKTSWLDNHLRFNGAFFYEDWKNFQFGFLGQNSFTIVRNAGSAHIKGAEQQLEWVPIPGLNLHLAATELDPKTERELLLRRRSSDRSAAARPRAVPRTMRCPTARSCRSCRSSRAMRRHATPSRSEARTCRGIGQAAYSYTSSTNSTLSPYQNNLIGSVPAYGLLDLAAGINKGSFQAELFASNALDKRAQTYRFAECTVVAGLQTGIAGTNVCGGKPMATIATPRTIGIRFSQSF